MIECDASIKKWGNSLGIVLPKNTLKENNIQTNDKIHVLITKVTKENPLQKLWGALPDIGDSEELEKFVDKEFDI